MVERPTACARTLEPRRRSETGGRSAKQAREKDRGVAGAVFLPGLISHFVAAFGRRGSLTSV